MTKAKLHLNDILVMSLLVQYKGLTVIIAEKLFESIQLTGNCENLTAYRYTYSKTNPNSIAIIPTNLTV